MMQMIMMRKAREANAKAPAATVSEPVFLPALLLGNVSTGTGSPSCDVMFSGGEVGVAEVTSCWEIL